MRKFPFILIAVTYAIALICIINTGCSTSKRSDQSLQDTVCVEESLTTDSDKTVEKLWLDTMMYAAGHSFGYNGDMTMWGGWYYDTIPVGDDIMLKCDSVAPATIKLSLITREVTVNLGSPDAPEVIKNFLNPIERFKRIEKVYEVYVDSAMTEELGNVDYNGYISVITDYLDKEDKNSALINKFICNLAYGRVNSKVKGSHYPASYTYYYPALQSEEEHGEIPGNIDKLADFVIDKTIDKWKRSDCLSPISTPELELAIRAHVDNHNFVTFSKHEYNKEGTGHGMYWQTFHSLDLKNGKELNNNDIFISNTLEKVKSLLFEEMAQDPYYLEWHPAIESADDVSQQIEDWQTRYDGEENQKRKKAFAFNLPKGALTDSGVIFSFQPYEIGAWVAGAFHFTVPYEKLMPYLTTKAKNLIER